MLEHLYLADYVTNPPTKESDPTGMRAYFYNRLIELARTVEVEVKVGNDGEEELNADVRVEFPDDQNERLLDLFGMFDEGRLRSLVAVADEYVRQAKDQIDEIAERNGESDQGVNFAEQVIVTASVTICTQIHAAAKRLLEGDVDVGDEADDKDDDGDKEFDVPELEGWRGESEYDDGDGELRSAFAALPDEEGQTAFLDIDVSIVDAAELVPVNLTRLLAQYRAIQNYLDEQFDIECIEDTTPEYQSVQRAILERLPEVAGTHVTVVGFLSLRSEPSIAALLARLPEEQADHCFVTVFENIAQDALYEVEAFSDKIDANIGDEEADSESEILMATYVDYLKDRHGLS